MYIHGVFIISSFIISFFISSPVHILSSIAAISASVHSHFILSIESHILSLCISVIFSCFCCSLLLQELTKKTNPTIPKTTIIDFTSFPIFNYIKL